MGLGVGLGWPLPWSSVPLPRSRFGVNTQILLLFRAIGRLHWFLPGQGEEGPWWDMGRGLPSQPHTWIEVRGPSTRGLQHPAPWLRPSLHPGLLLWWEAQVLWRRESPLDHGHFEGKRVGVWVPVLALSTWPEFQSHCWGWHIWGLLVGNLAHLLERKHCDL